MRSGLLAMLLCLAPFACGGSVEDETKTTAAGGSSSAGAGGSGGAGSGAGQGGTGAAGVQPGAGSGGAGAGGAGGSGAGQGGAGEGGAGQGGAGSGGAGSDGAGSGGAGSGGAGTTGTGAAGLGMAGVQPYCEASCYEGKIIPGGNYCPGGTTDFVTCGEGTCAPKGQACPGAGGAGGGPSVPACEAGAGCVPGEWCMASGGADFCMCPATEPSSPAKLACEQPYPLGQSAFVCYDPGGEKCMVPGLEVIALFEPWSKKYCAALVSAGANPSKTSTGADRCCYMFQFSGCD